MEPRRKAERALAAVVQEAYVHGVSTRKVDELVKALGMSAIEAVLQGASWQRCRRVYFMRNALSLVLKVAQQMVGATIRTVFAQPDSESAHQQWRKVSDGFRARFPKLSFLMDEAEEDVLSMSFRFIRDSSLYASM